MKKTAKNTKNSKVEAGVNKLNFTPLVDGKSVLKPIKATKKATKEDIARARDFLKSLQPARCKATTINVIEAIEAVNEFDLLAQFVRAYYEGATVTNKAIRFKTKVASYSVWRRASNVRIYTNNPVDFVGVDWVADTHEIGKTHSTYTDALTIIKYLMNE